MAIASQSGTSVASITFFLITVIMNFVELHQICCALQLLPVQQLFLQPSFETILLQAAIFTDTIVVPTVTP